MNKADAIRILEESFLRPTSTPNIGTENREQYIKENQKYLIEHSIEPVMVEAFTSQWAKDFTDFTNESYQMLCIAKSERRELLYDEDNKTFSLAVRNEKGKLYLVGYASTDALAEWLG
jgi:hypothetical protein